MIQKLERKLKYFSHGFFYVFILDPKTKDKDTKCKKKEKILN